MKVGMTITITITITITTATATATATTTTEKFSDKRAVMIFHGLRTRGSSQVDSNMRFNGELHRS